MKVNQGRIEQASSEGLRSFWGLSSGPFPDTGNTRNNWSLEAGRRQESH